MEYGTKVISDPEGTLRQRVVNMKERVAQLRKEIKNVKLENEKSSKK
jgi:hypothetical protein